MKKILVVGSINQDVTLQMKNLPSPGETVIAQTLKTSLGGKGANQAVAASRMGGDVSFLGAIGSDKGSDYIIQQLKDDQINTDGIARLIESTGSAYISIDENAENNIVVYPGANFSIKSEHLYNNEQLFIESDYCLLQLEIPIEVIKETLKICHKHGVKVILNPAPYNDLIDSEIFNSVDYYIPNEIEFLDTIGASTDKSYDLDWIKIKAKEFSEDYDLTLIITLGSRGALLVEEGNTTLIPVHKTTPVDTTAAGDTFIGAFLADLSKGETLYDSLVFGSKVASVTISRYGAISAIPYRKEIN